MVKKSFYIILAIVALLVVDLYTFEIIVEDPGYYVVARRSDNPKQVLDALDRIKPKKISTEKLETLLSRYRQKANDPSISSKNRTLWKKASKRVMNRITDAREP